VRRGQKAADLIRNRKMAELPMDEPWQVRSFCFNESLKGRGGKKIYEKSAKHGKEPWI
jgi:hypothetical protein